MDETKQNRATCPTNQHRNGLRLGTGCAHASVYKKTKGVTR
jgi:hypothetical protein